MGDTVDVTKKYYDSGDADEFYFRIWGGEDIHVGMYASQDESIFDASRRTVETMAEKISHLPGNTRVLDVGAGYGGAARFLAEKFGFHVTCLNLSTVQNARNREMNRKAGLDSQVEVVDGNFEELPFKDDSFNLIWCQDAILHSSKKQVVFNEIDRVMKSGAEFILTDPMQVDGAAPQLLEPVLKRIHLDSMGSIPLYLDFAKQLNWSLLQHLKHPECLIQHYSSVLANLEARDADLKNSITPQYIENMKAGLRHWINAGKNNVLDWGILHFRK